MIFPLKNKNHQKLNAVMDVCTFTGRGLHKRIDENRQLLEFLYKEAPDLMEKCHFIEGWIKGQDAFLQELGKALYFPAHVGSTTFPRPWTGKNYDESSSLHWPINSK